MTHYAHQLSFMHLKAIETNLSKSQVILNSEFILMPLFTQMDDIICILKMRNQLWGSSESKIRIGPKTSRPPLRLKRETLKTRTSISGANLKKTCLFFFFFLPKAGFMKTKTVGVLRGWYIYLMQKTYG